MCGKEDGVRVGVLVLKKEKHESHYDQMFNNMIVQTGRVFVYPVFTGKLYKQTLKEDAPWPVIDIVYTWVNGSDPRLRESKS